MTLFAVRARVRGYVLSNAHAATPHPRTGVRIGSDRVHLRAVLHGITPLRVQCEGGQHLL